MSNKRIGSRKEKSSNIENYIPVMGQNRDNLAEIYRLAHGIGIERLDIDESIRLLGDKNTLIYINFFSEHLLPKESFLSGISAIVNKVISIGELKSLEKRSDLETSVRDIVAKFNLREEQLKQKDYRDNVSDSCYYFEHFSSRLDREPD